MRQSARASGQKKSRELKQMFSLIRKDGRSAGGAWVLKLLCVNSVRGKKPPLNLIYFRLGRQWARKSVCFLQEIKVRRARWEICRLHRHTPTRPIAHAVSERENQTREKGEFASNKSGCKFRAVWKLRSFARDALHLAFNRCRDTFLSLKAARLAKQNWQNFPFLSRWLKTPCC